MLLIFFFCLIAKITLAYSDCDVGSQGVKNFDWSKFSGPRPWYGHLHTPNDIDNDLDCPLSTYASPEGNISLITDDGYSISEQRHITIYGNATNWNPTGYWDESYQIPSFFYVAYRSQHPNKATVLEVLKELKKNHIDICKLVEWPTDHCQ